MKYFLPLMYYILTHHSPNILTTAELSTKDPSKLALLSTQQINLVIDLLLELMTGDFVDERETMLQKCMSNIQWGTSVAVSMKLSRKILETFPVTKRSWLRCTHHNISNMYNLVYNLASKDM